LSPRKLQAIRGGSKVVDATVNTYYFTVAYRKRDFTLHSNVNVKILRSLIVAKGGRSRLMSLEQFSLEVANGKKKLESSGYCRDRNLPVLFIEESVRRSRFMLVGLNFRGLDCLRFFLATSATLAMARINTVPVPSSPALKGGVCGAENVVMRETPVGKELLCGTFPAEHSHYLRLPLHLPGRWLQLVRGREIAVADELLKQIFAILRSGIPYDPHYFEKRSDVVPQRT